MGFVCQSNEINWLIIYLNGEGVILKWIQSLAIALWNLPSKFAQSLISGGYDRLYGGGFPSYGGGYGHHGGGFGKFRIPNYYYH